MIKVGILGATSYTALETIKLLLRHPEAKIAFLASRREERPHIADIFPELKGRIDMHCVSFDDEQACAQADVIISGLPRGVSMSHCAPFVKLGPKVIDLSADYRLDAAEYKKWYKADHVDVDGLKSAVYGLPELFRDEIRSATLIANPGCYPTSALLALAPLAKAGLLADEVIIDSKSGVSGAGRTPTQDTHFSECNESVHAYRVGEHGHQPEIAKCISKAAGKSIGVTFVPHLIPMDRGIFTTAYVRMQKPIPQDDLDALYAEFYKDEPFVRPKEGSALPRTKDVKNTNFCDVATRVVGGDIVVLSCIDNLVKGAAGQAIQNMNLMCGVDETLGLV